MGQSFEESIKVYCPNVGLVIDEELELIAVYDGADPPEAEDQEGTRPSKGDATL